MAKVMLGQFWRFALSGVVGFLVDAGIVWLLTHSLVNAIVAQGVAFFMAVTVTWWFNRTFTFSQWADHRLLHEWALYLSANSIGAAVNNGVYVFLVLSVSMMAKNPVFAVAAGSLAGLLFNFTASRILVFHHSS